MTLNHAFLSTYKPSKDFVETITISKATYDELVAKAQQLDELTAYNITKGSFMKSYQQEICEIALKICCSWYKQPPELVLSKTRKPNILKVRDAIILCLTKSSINLNDIAHFLGKRDHTTVIHNRDKVLGYMDVDELYKKEMNNILNIYKIKIQELHKEKTMQ